MATASAPLAPTAPLDLIKVVNAYRRIRDARADLKKAFETQDEQLKAQQDQLGAALLGHLNAHNATTMKTDAGTFYKQEEVKPSIVDDMAFYAWVHENNLAADALERRAKVGFVKEFMDNHEGLPPPGISVHREFAVRVRKPS